MDVELRPLGLGEILDRIFNLYKAHFLMFAGISTFAAGLDLIWKLIQTGIVRAATHHVATMTLGIFNTGFALITLMVFIVASAVAMAAINRAVSAIYLGQQTGIAQSYDEVKAHWFRYVRLYIVAALLAWGPALIAFVGILLLSVVMVRSGGRAGVPPALAFVGIFGLSMVVLVPLGIWMTLRYSLSNACCVFEDLGVRASLQRSIFLSKGLRGKIFVMVFLAWCISAVISYGCLTPLIIIGFKSAMAHAPLAISLGMTIYTLLIGFIVSSVTIPFYGIGLTLFYYDARIRKEGFDIEWMMQRATPAEIPAPLSDMPSSESILG